MLVLVDGARLDLAGMNDSADLSQFPIASTQRVEYIHGPCSAIYSSDAIDGVMNVITTHGRPGTKISTRWGSNSYQNCDVSTQQQLRDKTRVTPLGDYVHTRSYDVVAYGNIGTQAQPDNDGFLNKTLYNALKHNFTDV